MAVTTINAIDEELNQFEKDIRQLKIEYEQYFGGGRKRPPTEIEWRLELMAKRYAERSGELKYGQRFRYNNLTQTYSKYKDIFRKRLQQKEEGKVSRHFGSAAKKIEAERAQKHAETVLKADAAESKKSDDKALATFRVVCSKPEQEAEKISKLYEAFLEAKQKAGEDTIKFTRSNFHEFVMKKTKDLQKTKNCKDVEYVVEVTEGHVKLKALVKI
ncbi:MAG TPA: MXAN_5187 C-terminal domain-containing protein [Candidatus Acidoferrum sp.]